METITTVPGHPLRRLRTGRGLASLEQKRKTLTSAHPRRKWSLWRHGRLCRTGKGGTELSDVGRAEQSLCLAAVEFDAVGVPVEMIRVGLVEWLEERIVGALVRNHGVVAMTREDCHVAGKAHELIHQ